MFGVTVRLMSDGELRRLEVLQDLDRRRLTAASRGAPAEQTPRLISASLGANVVNLRPFLALVLVAPLALGGCARTADTGSASGLGK